MKIKNSKNNGSNEKKTFKTQLKFLKNQCCLNPISIHIPKFNP